MSAQGTPDRPVVQDPTPIPSRLRSRHLLSIADLTPEEVLLILDTAEAMKEIGTRPIKKVPTLRGKTVVNLFFEPSTPYTHVVRDCRETAQRRHPQRRHGDVKRQQRGDPD